MLERNSLSAVAAGEILIQSRVNEEVMGRNGAA
jgi:hypothetical protein